MGLSQLKKEIHAYVDEVDDEKALLAVAEVLEKYGLASVEKNDYEQSEEFNLEISKALQQAGNNELYPTDETISWLKGREWRTK